MKPIILALIVTLLISGCAFANRLILAPTGSTLVAGQTRVEAALKASDSMDRVYFLGTGLGRVEVSTIRFGGEQSIFDFDDDDVLNLAIGILPETSFTPGISLGVWDVTADISADRGYYAAVSKRLSTPVPLPLVSDLNVHAGMGIGGTSGVFGGVEAGLGYGVKLAAEYFQNNVNLCLSWSPIKQGRLKAYWLDGDPYYGAEIAFPL